MSPLVFLTEFLGALHSRLRGNYERGKQRNNITGKNRMTSSIGQLVITKQMWLPIYMIHLDLTFNISHPTAKKSICLFVCFLFFKTLFIYLQGFPHKRRNKIFCHPPLPVEKGNWVELTFAKASGTVTGDREKKALCSWPFTWYKTFMLESKSRTGTRQTKEITI